MVFEVTARLSRDPYWRNPLRSCIVHFVDRIKTEKAHFSGNVRHELLGKRSNYTNLGGGEDSVSTFQRSHFHDRCAKLSTADIKGTFGGDN